VKRLGSNELANCKDISDYVKLEDRLTKQIVEITKDLSLKQLLECDDNEKLLETKAFAGAWSEITSRKQYYTRNLNISFKNCFLGSMDEDLGDNNEEEENLIAYTGDGHTSSGTKAST